MEIFRELNKKGYKHYYGGTIEELDTMDKNNPDLHSEIMQVVMWLYDKHKIWIEVRKSNYFRFDYTITKGTENLMYEKLPLHKSSNSPTKAYQEAINYCLTKLI